MWGMGVLAASRGASESNALGRGSRAGWGALPSTMEGGEGLTRCLLCSVWAACLPRSLKYILMRLSSTPR